MNNEAITQALSESISTLLLRTDALEKKVWVLERELYCLENPIKALLAPDPSEPDLSTPHLPDLAIISKLVAIEEEDEK